MLFAQPGFLIALPLVPLLLLFLAWAGRRRAVMMQRLGDAPLMQRLSASVNWRGRRLRDALWLLGLAMLIIALARPQWGTESQPVERQGIQVMVALDVSNSMLAGDIRPDRLTRAKGEIADLMQRLDGDEIGLVLFSGASFIQFPLTSDYATARTFLDAADTRSISRQGTVIGDAIRTAITGFDLRRESQKVIVIVTDGEAHDSDAIAAAEAAAQQGIIIHTVGLGSPEGAPVPEYDANGQLTGYKTDASGQTVVSKLDENTLRQIAAAAGGQYFHAADGSEIDALAAELAQLQGGDIESRTAFTYIERFQFFLLIAFLAMGAAELIPDRKAGRLRLRLRIPTLLPALRRSS
jgi:Ca-activated chloride channel homolog